MQTARSVFVHMLVQCLQRTAWQSISLQRLGWWKTPSSSALTHYSLSEYRLVIPPSSHRHTVLKTKSVSPYSSLFFTPWALSLDMVSWKTALYMRQPKRFKSGTAAAVQGTILTSCSHLHCKVQHSASSGQPVIILGLSCGFFTSVSFRNGHPRQQKPLAWTVNVGIPGWRPWQ